MSSRLWFIFSFLFSNVSKKNRTQYYLTDPSAGRILLCTCTKTYPSRELIFIAKARGGRLLFLSFPVNRPSSFCRQNVLIVSRARSTCSYYTAYIGPERMAIKNANAAAARIGLHAHARDPAQVQRVLQYYAPLVQLGSGNVV